MRRKDVWVMLESFETRAGQFEQSKLSTLFQRPDREELPHLGEQMEAVKPESAGGLFDSRPGLEELPHLEDKDVNEKQIEEIQKAIKRIASGKELTTAEKGNLCEMMMDQYYISKGYTPLHERVTSLDDKGHQGIDGVYEKDGKYVIVDAKYGTAQLGETQDGKQMSAEWIDKRLDDAVGKAKADEIRNAYEDDPENVSTEVYHFDPVPDANGSMHSDIYPVDENGIKCGERTQVEAYNRDGTQIIQEDDRSERDA